MFIVTTFFCRMLETVYINVLMPQQLLQALASFLEFPEKTQDALPDPVLGSSHAKLAALHWPELTCSRGHLAKWLRARVPES